MNSIDLTALRTIVEIAIAATGIASHEHKKVWASNRPEREAALNLERMQCKAGNEILDRLQAAGPVFLTRTKSEALHDQRWSMVSETQYSQALTHIDWETRRLRNDPEPIENTASIPDAARTDHPRVDR